MLKKPLLAMLLFAIFGLSGAWPVASQEAADGQPPAATRDDKPTPPQPEEDPPPTGEQPPPENPDPKPEDPAADAGPKAQAYAKAMTEWKSLLNKLRTLREQYTIAETKDLEKLRKEYNDLLGEGKKQHPALIQLAREAYLEAPNEDRQLTRFLVAAAADGIRDERYDTALEISQLLLDNHCDDKNVSNIAGIALFHSNRFEEAEKHLNQAKKDKVVTRMGDEALASLAEAKATWAEEAKLREAEAKADDLPRVKLKTTQGDIVLELFENEAPDTVGNFISLVEQGFYDGRVFHRVLPAFMAQTGCPKGDGSGGPGYKIYDECDKTPHRNHFAGSVSMAHSGPDTGGSQFFITFKPTTHLNGLHTVFGRVLEGMDVVAKIQRIDPNQPPAKRPELDKIVEAEVLRKRDHEYKPNKVK
jgi:cyclophilin family peptidyl-prolyl cis-trans isomerase